MGPRGRRFESCLPDQWKSALTGFSDKHSAPICQTGARSCVGCAKGLISEDAAGTAQPVFPITQNDAPCQRLSLWRWLSEYACHSRSLSQAKQTCHTVSLSARTRQPRLERIKELGAERAGSQDAITAALRPSPLQARAPGCAYQSYALGKAPSSSVLYRSSRRLWWFASDCSTPPI